MKKELTNLSRLPHKISLSETDSFECPEFDGHVYVAPDTNQGFNVLAIDVHGGHPRKRMLGDTTRTYYVIEGSGSFTVGDDIHNVAQGDLFVIPPDGEYSYDGQMRLLEVNISPTNTFQDEKL